MAGGNLNFFGHMAPEIMRNLLWLTKLGEREAHRDVILLS